MPGACWGHLDRPAGRGALRGEADLVDPDPRQTVDRYRQRNEVSTKGRQTHASAIRAVPIGEAMVACVIADHYLRQRAASRRGSRLAVQEAVV
jgi:chorismate synthase